MARNRGASWLCICLLIFLGLTRAADPKDDPAPEEKRYDNKDLEKLRSKAEKQAPSSTPAQPQAASAENSYSNADLSKLPQPTQLPEAPVGQAPAYTNQDLAPAAAAGEPAPDVPADAAAAIETAKADVNEAQGNVDELEARLRAVRNPFLPRPVLPPDEEQAWQGLDNAARSARVEAQLKDAREKLAGAIEKLSTLQGPATP